MADDQQVVVIGSGPSGAMAAHALIHRGVPVLMLESGSHFPRGLLVRISGRNVYRVVSGMKGGKLNVEPGNGIENGNLHTVTGDPRTVWWSCFMPGGFSNQWTGAVPRFAPRDFCEGERIDERYCWPVNYEDLAPYYQRVEPLMCINGDNKPHPNLPVGCRKFRRVLADDWQHIAACAEARGQGLAVTPVADGPPFLVALRGTAFNSFTNIVRPLMASPNFKLIAGAHALKLEYSASKGKVDGVVYYDRADGSQHRVKAAAVIVACGPLNSTKLLFDSTCNTFPQGLGNTAGVLGQYLHDHPRDWWTFTVEKPLSRPNPSVYLTRRPHKDSPPLLATSCTIGLYPTLGEKALSFLPGKAALFGVQVFGTMVPSQEHFVRPDKQKKDEHGLAALEVRIRYDEETLANVIDAREQLLSLLAEAGHPGKLRDLPTEFEPGSSVHYGGTVRMHASPEYGMTDAWNRLHAVPNVLVTDASCFTTGPEKNPTLTAMALSARAADHLADQFQTG